MLFDFAWDFRNTAPFVIDPAYAVPDLSESYPHTYTNANGLSVNAGFTVATSFGGLDRANTNDPRIAGIVAHANNGSTTANFRVDLSSGSAPGAGNYTVDFAFGDASAPQQEDAALLDDTTVKILLSKTNTAAGHYIDASLADVAATTTWTGTPTAVTFASTTVNVHLNQSLTFLGTNTALAHFRLTQASAPANITPNAGALALVGQAALLTNQPPGTKMIGVMAG